MNPSTHYGRLTSLRRNQSFDPEASQTVLTLQFQSEPVVKIQTKGKRTFYLRRHLPEEEPLLVYRVFVDEGSAAAGENEVAYCRLRQPEDGIVVINDAEVKEPFRRKGIATAVYDCIARDMERVGALLWPVAPAKMTDAEFRMWWRCSPALVFYYPHRERLGFEPRHEFDELLNAYDTAKAPAKPGFRASAASEFRDKLTNVGRWLFRRRV